MAKAAAERSDDLLDYAMWWVARWVSGSMTDPDWSWPEAETITVDEAFAVVQDRIGNGKSVLGPFWRFLSLPQDEADRLLAGGELRPNPASTFQSFTGTFDLAHEFGADEPGRKGNIPVVVRLEVPAEHVMFGMEDLLADRRAAETVRTLDLWHHQKEIVVRVDRPLRVLEAYTIDPAALGGLGYVSALETPSWPSPAF